MNFKHFVSERKYDEELGRVARFSCDLEALKRSIAAFGHGECHKNPSICHKNPSFYPKTH